MMTPPRIAKVGAYLDVADRKLNWAAASFDEMRAHSMHARMSDVERVFASTLVHIAAAHDQLEDAAGDLGLDDKRLEIEELRKSDPLLFWLWQARDKDVHTPIVTYREGMHHFKLLIVDSIKAAPIARQFYVNPTEAQKGANLAMYVFDVKSMKSFLKVVKSGQLPSTERLEKAGVVIDGVHQSLTLMSFESRVGRKKVMVSEPLSHLGNPMTPSASVAIPLAITFYRRLASDLRTQYDALK